MDPHKVEQIRKRVLQSKKLANALDSSITEYFYGKPDFEVERLTTDEVDALVENFLGEE